MTTVGGDADATARSAAGVEPDAAYAAVLASAPLPAWIEVVEPSHSGARAVSYVNPLALSWLGERPLSFLLQQTDDLDSHAPPSDPQHGRLRTRRCALDGRGRVWAVWLLTAEPAADGFYRQILERQDALVLRHRADGKITYLNPAAGEHFELGRDDQRQALTLLTLLAPDDFRMWQSAVARLDPTQASRGHRLELVKAASSGKVRVTDFRLHGMFDEAGVLTEVIAVGHDVTQSKQEEHALGDALGEVEKLTRQLESERSYLREEVSAMVTSGAVIGESPAMRTLLEQVVTVAQTDSTVLILGETGTGKEVLARMLHQASGRAHQALVKVNCAALPAPLVESELFGHERGAFTGALSRRQGRFEVADRGTIFLDEIGEVPLDTQAKLLRVLQEHEFERVGSSKPIRVNVRVVAATNRDLSVEVEKGRFRADLYYRLAVFPLRIPSLKERVSDIPLLAEHFARRFARERNRKECRGFTPNAMQWLVEYHWPGNVRELQSVVERALILLKGELIDLPLLQIGGAAPTAAQAVKPALHHDSANEPLVTLEEMERRYIERVLHECGARIEGDDGAAALLALPPSTLRSRMRKLGIRRPPSASE